MNQRCSQVNGALGTIEDFLKAFFWARLHSTFRYAHSAKPSDMTQSLDPCFQWSLRSLALSGDLTSPDMIVEMGLLWLWEVCLSISVADRKQCNYFDCGLNDYNRSGALGRCGVRENSQAGKKKMGSHGEASAWPSGERVSWAGQLSCWNICSRPEAKGF